MSRKRPQNGPSLSKPTYSAKPLTDEELAAKRAKEKIRQDLLAEKQARGRAFGAQIKRFGNTIPITGPGAEEFWKDLQEPARQIEDYELLLTEEERAFYRASKTRIETRAAGRESADAPADTSIASVTMRVRGTAVLEASNDLEQGTKVRRRKSSPKRKQARGVRKAVKKTKAKRTRAKPVQHKRASRRTKRQ